MKAIRQRAWGWIVVAFFGLLVSQAPASEQPLNVDELKRFIAESAPFLEWVRTNHQERVFDRLMDQPRSITEFPETVQFLRNHKWDPERFAYILNHVITAYKRLAMGKDPYRVLTRLEETKVAVQKDLTQSESEKARTLSIIAEAQQEVRKTDKAFAEIPADEVRLIWLHRVELHQALDGRFPIRKRVLPNPANAR